jgi:hypothetical protein
MLSPVIVVFFKIVHNVLKQLAHRHKILWAETFERPFPVAEHDRGQFLLGCPAGS